MMPSFPLSGRELTLIGVNNLGSIFPLRCIEGQNETQVRFKLKIRRAGGEGAGEQGHSRYLRLARFAYRVYQIE